MRALAKLQAKEKAWAWSTGPSRKSDAMGLRSACPAPGYAAPTCTWSSGTIGQRAVLQPASTHARAAS